MRECKLDSLRMMGKSCMLFPPDTFRGGTPWDFSLWNKRRHTLRL